MSFNFDSLGSLLVLIKDDTDADAIHGGRVRGFEAAPQDAQGPGHYQPFVVLVILDTPREKRIPVQRPRIAGRFYGTTAQQAMQLYTACSNAVHDHGPQLRNSGLGIWNTWDDTGATAEKDPDTGQPYVTAVFSQIATTAAVV